MSATHGSTHRIGRVVAVCLVALVALFALVANADAKKAKETTKTYLALGDSLAFGYSQQLYNENWSAGDPATAFEHGYVQDYAAKLAGHKEYQTTNLGCPGETSKSLIGNGPLGTALEGAFGASTEAPCAYQEGWNAFHKDGTGGPLHTPYVGKSQLEAALEQIAIDAAIGKPVAVITLNIGANDELAVVHGCEKEVTEEYEAEGKSKYEEVGHVGPAEAVHLCLVDHVPSLVKTIITNTEAAGYAIRNGAAFGGVNYTGKIDFVASYDPYGSVFVAGEELLGGSVGLASVINEQEAAHFSQGFNPGKEEAGFEACIANPLPKFNPTNKKEPSLLQKWTNMANFAEVEVEPGVNKADGPDIHPTPEGYKEMSKILQSACGR